MKLKWNGFESEMKSYFQTDNVFLFVPNIVGYIRIVLLFLFAWFAYSGSHQLATICYIVSVGLDEIDGNIARYMKQTSTFGMVLDIVTDEMTVLCLCTILSTLYPKYLLYFQFCTMVDIAGQWCNYQHAAMFRGNDYTRKDDPILNIYFNKKVFMNLWVYGNHLFLLMLYVCSFSTGFTVDVFGYQVGVWQVVACLAAPWSMSRSLLMFYMLVLAMSDIARHDSAVYRRRNRLNVDQNGHTAKEVLQLNGVCNNNIRNNDLNRRAS